MGPGRGRDHLAMARLVMAHPVTVRPVRATAGRGPEEDVETGPAVMVLPDRADETEQHRLFERKWISIAKPVLSVVERTGLLSAASTWVVCVPGIREALLLYVHT